MSIAVTLAAYRQEYFHEFVVYLLSFVNAFVLHVRLDASRL